MRFLYICPFANFSRDFFMRFLYICPFTNFSRDFSMHFLYICPSGNFHRDFLAYLFSICPQNTRKRARKRECSTHGNIPSFIYVFIFPVLSVHCCPHPPHDRPHYGLLIRSQTTMPHLRPTQQLLLQSTHGCAQICFRYGRMPDKFG